MLISICLFLLVRAARAVPTTASTLTEADLAFLEDFYASEAVRTEADPAREPAEVADCRCVPSGCCSRGATLTSAQATGAWQLDERSAVSAPLTGCLREGNACCPEEEIQNSAPCQLAGDGLGVGCGSNTATMGAWFLTEKRRAIDRLLIICGEGLKMK